MPLTIKAREKLFGVNGPDTCQAHTQYGVPEGV